MFPQKKKTGIQVSRRRLFKYLKMLYFMLFLLFISVPLTLILILLSSHALKLYFALTFAHVTEFFKFFTPLSVNHKKLHHSGGQNNYLMFSSFQPFSFASSFKVSGEFASALWIVSWVLLFTTIMLLGSKALLGSSFFRVI